MEFQQALDVLSKFMNESIESGMILGPKRQEVDKTIRFILDDISNLQKDSKVDPSESKISSVKNMLILYKHIFNDMVISKEFSGFLEAYLLLVSNWNDAIYKDESIKTEIKFLNNHRRLHFTTVEVLNQSKELLRKFRSLQGFALPSIEMSKHFLARFDEKVKEKGSSDKRQIDALKINTPSPKKQSEQQLNIIDVKDSSAEIVYDVLKERMDADKQVVKLNDKPSHNSTMSDKLTFNKKI